MGISVNRISMKVVSLVLVLRGLLVNRFLGFGLKLCVNRPILDLYSFIEQPILVVYCHLLILQV